ncbi:DUF262 domain-containing protein [Myxococcota bacterium]|nr:DUF262 domain-containing protein [Myxococcota bacterium]
MDINAGNSTLRQLLGNGLTYRVPPFQRDYSWTDDEWDDLWLDILGLFDEDGESAHYMGYLVLQSSDSKQFEIIDGQQRITTLSVLILAALAHLKDLVAAGKDGENNQLRIDALQNSYIGYVDPVSLVARSKLELNRHNNKFYQTYLAPLAKIPARGLNASEHQLRKAFIWFKERIKSHTGQGEQSGKQVAAFVDSLVDKLFFTVITVTDELNAFKVFETLNARGVRLSSTDLLKNYLFSVISSGSSHDAELKSVEDRWEHIVGLLGSESFPEFLRAYWNSQYKLVRKSELFKTIRRRIDDREAAFELLHGMDSDAEIYAALRDPQGEIWNSEEKQALEQLMMFNVRQPLPMLLACYRRFGVSERRVFTRVLKAISVISFRYNVISHLPPSEQERVYNDVARKITDGSFTKLKDILRALAEVYPEDAIFKAAFADKTLRTSNSRNRKVARYTLFELEKHQSGQAYDFESALYSLEHIWPINPDEGWDDIDPLLQDRMVYRLGNMTLMKSGENRDIGNVSYAEKRKVYEKSTFSLTRGVAEHNDEWAEARIDSRQNRLADLAVAI